MENQLLNYFECMVFSKIDKKYYAAAGPIVWFILVAIVSYAFYCTYKGYNFGIVANPLKLGCYR